MKKFVMWSKYCENVGREDGAVRASRALGASRAPRLRTWYASAMAQNQPEHSARPGGVCVGTLPRLHVFQLRVVQLLDASISSTTASTIVAGDCNAPTGIPSIFRCSTAFCPSTNGGNEWPTSWEPQLILDIIRQECHRILFPHRLCRDRTAERQVPQVFGGVFHHDDHLLE